MAFDYTRCPEFAGPLTEPRTMDGRPVLDIQALARHSVRLPQLNPAAAPGEYIPVSRSEPLLDPDTRERERAEAAARYDAGEEALRAMFAGAARSAGADQLTARRTADELLKRAGTATPGIT